MDKWISIKHRFPNPEKSRAYLCTDGEDIQVMWWFGEYKHSPDWSSLPGMAMDVTHWMELPDLPKLE